MSSEIAAIGGAAVRIESDDTFVALFYEHAARMVNFARMLGADEPEDVAQETFCKLYAARQRLEGFSDSHRIAYVNKTLVNEVRSRHRRRATALRAPHHAFEPQPQRDDDPADRRSVIDALRELPLRKREALVLRYWADMPIKQIADVMGVRIGTVKSLLSRGLDALAVELGEER